MKDRILNIAARTISFLLFPLFMPLYGITLLFQLPIFSFYPRFYVVACFYITILFCLIIPLGTYLLLAHLNVISSPKMYEKEDRSIPLALTAVSFLCCAVMLCKYAMPIFIVNIMVSVSIATLITAVISRWWKISAHMTGVGGLTAAILLVSLCTFTNPTITICGALLCAGLLASARLQLQRHTPQQIVAGFLNGVGCILLFSTIDWGMMIRRLLAVF